MELARWFPPMVCSSFLEGGKGEVPGELVALALARPMQLKHIGAEQHPDPQATKPLDPLPERGMFALGGIQHRQCRKPGWVSRRPSGLSVQPAGRGACRRPAGGVANRGVVGRWRSWVNRAGWRQTEVEFAVRESALVVDVPVHATCPASTPLQTEANSVPDA